MSLPATLKVRAFLSDYLPSEVLNLNYTLKKLSTPLVSIPGGIFDSGIFDSNELYIDIVTNLCPVLTETISSESLANINTKRCKHASFVIKDVGYIIGGVGGEDNVTYLNTVEKYDPVLDTWTYVASMNTTRASHASFVLKDEGYVVGGEENNYSTSSVEKYNPTSNTWTYVASIQLERYHHSSLVS